MIVAKNCDFWSVFPQISCGRLWLKPQMAWPSAQHGTAGFKGYRPCRRPQIVSFKSQNISPIMLPLEEFCPSDWNILCLENPTPKQAHCKELWKSLWQSWQSGTIARFKPNGLPVGRQSRCRLAPSNPLKAKMDGAAKAWQHHWAQASSGTIVTVGTQPKRQNPSKIQAKRVAIWSAEPVPFGTFAGH